MDSYKVLIMEDDADTAKSVQEALSLYEVEAEIAEDGEKGLEKFKTGRYDLILLDLKMPMMSGDQVLKEIRKTDPFMDVVVYTNYQDYYDVQMLINLGLDGYIRKGSDADLEELVQLIMKKLKPMDAEGLSELLCHSDIDDVEVFKE